MKKTGWGLVTAAVVGMLFSTTAFAWEKGTHAYIADLLRKKLGAQNIEEMYGAMAPDAFNYLFLGPGIVYYQWLYEQTHFDFMKAWDAAGTGSERSAAAGFLSHNNAWGADRTAHAQSLTLDPNEGYVVTKAKMLHAIFMNDPGYAALFGSGDAQAAAIEFCHNLVEAAGDVILKRCDPDLGHKLAEIVKLPKADTQRLMVKAYAEDLALFSTSTPNPLSVSEAAGLIAQTENEFRQGAIGYGYLLQMDEATLIENIISEYQAMAAAFLAVYGLPAPPEEMLTALISGGLSIALDICAGDYMTEVLATADFVAGQLKDHGIK